MVPYIRPARIRSQLVTRTRFAVLSFSRACAIYFLGGAMNMLPTVVRSRWRRDSTKNCPQPLPGHPSEGICTVSTIAACFGTRTTNAPSRCLPCHIRAKREYLARIRLGVLILLDCPGYFHNCAMPQYQAPKRSCMRSCFLKRMGYSYVARAEQRTPVFHPCALYSN